MFLPNHLLRAPENSSTVSGNYREDTQDARKHMFDLIKATQPKFVIMVTNVSEKGRYKCTEYFTDYFTKDFKEISVFSQTEQMDGLDIRKAINGNEIYHFHYKKLPDSGVPKDYDDSIKFIVKKSAEYGDYTSSTSKTYFCSLFCGIGRMGHLF